MATIEIIVGGKKIRAALLSADQIAAAVPALARLPQTAAIAELTQAVSAAVCRADASVAEDHVAKVITLTELPFAIGFLIAASRAVAGAKVN